MKKITKFSCYLAVILFLNIDAKAQFSEKVFDKCGNIRSVAFSPTHDYIAMAYDNGSIYIMAGASYDLTKKYYKEKIHINVFYLYKMEQKIKDFHNAKKNPGNLLFTPDGKFLISGGWTYYDTNSKKLLNNIYLFDIDKFSVENSTVYDNKLKDFVTITTDNVILGFNISSSGKRVVLRTLSSEMIFGIEVFDIESRKKIFVKEFEATSNTKEMISDVVFGKDDSTIFYSKNDSVIEYSISNNKKNNAFLLKAIANRLFYNFSNNQLLASDFESSVYYWGNDKSKEPIVIKAKEKINEIAYNKAEDLYYTGGTDNKCYILNLSQSKIASVKPKPSSYYDPPRIVNKIIFSLNGNEMGVLDGNWAFEVKSKTK